MQRKKTKEAWSNFNSDCYYLFFLINLRGMEQSLIRKMIYSVMHFTAIVFKETGWRETNVRHASPTSNVAVSSRPPMSFTRLPASLISIWKDIQSQMCVWHDVLWNKFLIHGAFCDLWPSELSIWEEVLYFKYVFSCAKMLHHSLFSLDLCSTVVYQRDLLADGLPDVFSIFHSETHTYTHTVFVLKVRARRCFFIFWEETHALD